MRIFAAAVLLVVGALTAAPAFAQQVEIKAPPPVPTREPRIVSPGLQYEATRPEDADSYLPGGTRVPYDPAFIEPLAGTWQTTNNSGRAGLSGWTAPSTPVGAAATGNHDLNGWFALGFSVTWDGPPPARAKRPAPAR